VPREGGDGCTGKELDHWFRQRDSARQAGPDTIKAGLDTLKAAAGT